MKGHSGRACSGGGCLLSGGQMPEQVFEQPGVLFNSCAGEGAMFGGDVHILLIPADGALVQPALRSRPGYSGVAPAVQGIVGAFPVGPYPVILLVVRFILPFIHAGLTLLPERNPTAAMEGRVPVGHMRPGIAYRQQEKEETHCQKASGEYACTPGAGTAQQKGAHGCGPYAPQQTVEEVGYGSRPVTGVGSQQSVFENPAEWQGDDGDDAADDCQYSASAWPFLPPAGIHAALLESRAVAGVQIFFYKFLFLLWYYSSSSSSLGVWRSLSTI